MTVVSKTDYLLYRECKNNAWLKIHRPDVFYSSELSEFDKAVIETGNEVEECARRLFPSGILIEGRDEHSQELTRQHVANRTPVLFQPVFLRDNFLAAMDVLEFDAESNGYALSEVKASNSLKEDTHLSDLAFQWVLLEKAGLPVRKANIIHLNSGYTRSGVLNIQELFTIEDVTSSVQALLAETTAGMESAKAFLSKETEPVGHCGCVFKGRSRHCSTFAHSNPDVPAYGIHDIARIGNSKAKLVELVVLGIFRLEELPRDFELSEIQMNQVDAQVRNQVLLNKIGIAAALKKLVFPLYFLDYETCPVAIPRFDGYSPYQQIPFQYSLHILDRLDGTPRHEEFLSTTADDPGPALVASLQSHVGKTGSVVVWNKKFECGINEQMAERLPTARVFLAEVNNRVFDLMEVFQKQHYVHKDFRGGTSIKDVLPVLAPDLSYADLAIKEGGTASQAWDKITSSGIGQVEKETLVRDLKGYCERDTYAMYAIWRHLQDLLK